jgi:hypothetical protein
MFTKASITSDDKQTFAHPLTFKLFQLLQVVITYLLHCQRDLTSRLEEQTTHVRTLKEKHTQLVSSHRDILTRYKDSKHELNSLRSLVNDLRQPYASCPICHKKFKTEQYLDRHFRTKHLDVDPHWRALRGHNFVEVPETNLKELITQVQELRKATVKHTNVIDLFPKPSLNPFARNSIAQCDVPPDSRAVKRQAREFLRQQHSQEPPLTDIHISDAAEALQNELMSGKPILSEDSEMESSESERPDKVQFERVGCCSIDIAGDSALSDCVKRSENEPSLTDSFVGVAGQTGSIERELDEIENGSTDEMLDETDIGIQQIAETDGYSANLSEESASGTRRSQVGISRTEFDALFGDLDSESSQCHPPPKVNGRAMLQLGGPPRIIRYQ